MTSPYWDLRGVDREELLSVARSKVERLEKELRFWRSILSMLEGGEGWRPGERPEELRVGRRRIAVLYRGEDYVRVVPSFPMPDLAELRTHLNFVLNEIRELQVRTGSAEKASLEVRKGPEGSVIEIRYEGLGSAVELLKAKAALKHAVSVAWEVYRAQIRNGNRGCQEVGCGGR